VNEKGQVNKNKKIISGEKDRNGVLNQKRNDKAGKDQKKREQ
jgi:hypothetical protein